MTFFSYAMDRILERMYKRDYKILSSQELPKDIIEKSNISYIDDGNKDHQLDVYFSTNTFIKNDKLPVIIMIHGGGFIYGNKDINKLFGYHLAKRNFIVFNVNYPLAFNNKNNKVFNQIQDIIKAINWISDMENIYHINKEKVFLIGESAGAVLAIMTSLISRSERLQSMFKVSTVKLNIKSTGIISGMMKFYSNNPFFWFLRKISFEQNYINKPYYRSMIFESLPEIKDLPPIYLSSSDEDKIRDMTLNFARTLEENKVKYRLKYFKKNKDRRLKHVFCIMHPEYEESVELINDMLLFFNEVS